MQNCSTLSYIFTLLKFQSPYLGGGGEKKSLFSSKVKLQKLLRDFLGW